MKRPLRYRTMGAVREGRGNPSPYSISTPFRDPYGLRRNPLLTPKIKGLAQISGLRLSVCLISWWRDSNLIQGIALKNFERFRGLLVN